MQELLARGLAVHHSGILPILKEVGLLLSILDQEDWNNFVCNNIL